MLGKGVRSTTKVPLDAIVACVIVESGVSEELLRGPSRNRDVAEVRAMIGWLNWRLGSGSIAEAASYFQRDPSTLSRHIGNIDAKAARSERLQKTLDGLAH